jgi:hypothetical protein
VSFSSGADFEREGGKSSCVGRRRRYSWEFHGLLVAGVAQLAEHRFCKPTVVSSTLTASSVAGVTTNRTGRRRNGAARRHIEVATRLLPSGWIPKRPKGPDCKSGGTAFAGSNPAPPMGQGQVRFESGQFGGTRNGTIAAKHTEGKSDRSDWVRIGSFRSDARTIAALPCDSPAGRRCEAAMAAIGQAGVTQW